jgi:origin recognition complex subunit 1
MPPTASSVTSRKEQKAKAERVRKILSGGVATLRREDSDDELGYEDLPWEWVFTEAEDGSDEEEGEEGQEDTSRKGKRGRPSRKVSKSYKRRIIGARMGSFECKIGDCILLKADSNEAWAGIICDFLEEDEEKGVTVMCKMGLSFVRRQDLICC